MFDCLSNVMGSYPSGQVGIPIQTTNELLNGAMASTSDFDSDGIGLPAGTVSTTNVGFSLTGKVAHCE